MSQNCRPNCCAVDASTSSSLLICLTVTLAAKFLHITCANVDAILNIFELDALAEQCPSYSGRRTGADHHRRAPSILTHKSANWSLPDLRRVAHDIVPLSTTYEEQIKALREWATGAHAQRRP